MISEVRKARIIKGLRLDDIYLSTGIDMSRLSRIERKIFKPSKQEKKLIAKALNESVFKIFP